MGAATTLVTVREFLQLPEPEGLRMELLAGEVVTMGLGNLRHEVVKSNLIEILVGWLSKNSIGKLFSETLFQLDEHDSLIPDISVVFPGRIASGDTGWIQGAPEIAIEVVSSETADTLERKINPCLARGGKSVWVVFPEQYLVRTFDAAGQTRKFEQDQTLQDSALPGFSTPVSSIFEGT